VGIDIGSTVGDYQIIGMLGRGGMGRVFKVRNVISDRVEAMKCLRSYADAAPELTERFHREIKVLAKLEHPNITSFRTAFRVGDEILMVMEHVEGSSLDRRLKSGALETSRAVHYACQVLAALSYAHRAGVLHRDVKPSNILLGAGDSAKLTDFGIASLAGDAALTMTGNAMGSLHYMAPEQMRAEPLDARADVYSVGVTLYEMVTGRVPVKGDSFYTILKAHTDERPAPPMNLVPEVPAGLSDVIVKALEKDQKARFQTADDFRAALLSLSSTRHPSADLFAAAGVDSDFKLKVEEHVSTPKTWDPEVLEAAKRNLATYIGPMARVLVGRAADKARSVQDLYQILATEIPSLHDRDRFLRCMPL
jgi:eukaryotic-like serine/threonine-protein kinase